MPLPPTGSSAPYRFSVRPDPARNVLYLAQEGRPDRADLERFRDAYRAALPAVRPGFVLVHDQRGVQGFTDEALEVGKELVAITNAAAPRAVIRIAAAGLATRSRVSRVLVTARSHYQSLQVQTPEAAEALVAELLAKPK